MILATLKNAASTLLVLAAATLPFGPAHADGEHAMTDGTVRKVDMEQGKITIKHGPIENLDMPPMTMVFGTKDPAMLDGVEKGADVKFYAVMDGTNMVIEELEVE